MSKFSCTQLLKYSKLLKDKDIRKIVQPTLDEYDIIGIRKIEKIGHLIKVSLSKNDSGTVNFIFKDNKIIIRRSDANENFVEEQVVSSLPSVNITTLEKRPNGVIITKVNKEYDYSSYSDKEKTVVDLYSKRYVVTNATLDCSGLNELDLKDFIYNLDFMSKLDNLSSMITVFESHFDTLSKGISDLKWNRTTHYSTYTYLNGEDVSHIYDVVDGINKVSNIYDLYNGVINKRNIKNIFSIHLGLLNSDAFGLKCVRSIDLGEEILVGESLIDPSKKYVDEASKLLSSKFYCSKDIDFSSRESMMKVIENTPVLKKTIDNK